MLPRYGKSEHYNVGHYYIVEWHFAVGWSATVQSDIYLVSIWRSKAWHSYLLWWKTTVHWHPPAEIVYPGYSSLDLKPVSGSSKHATAYIFFFIHSSTQVPILTIQCRLKSLRRVWSKHLVKSNLIQITINAYTLSEWSVSTNTDALYLLDQLQTMLLYSSDE